MEIHFEIENHCLLKCRHCSSFAHLDGAIMQYSIQDIATFLKGIPEQKDVFFTGGEPLLYPKLELLFSTLNSQLDSISLNLFTTGILSVDGDKNPVSKSYANKLAACGLKVCYFSIYDNDKKDHDWMTNSNGSFAMTTTSIDYLKKFGIDIRFNTVITKRNISKVNEIINLAKELGASEVRLLKLVNHGKASDNWNDLELTNEEYRAKIQEVIAATTGIRITASSEIDIVPCRPMPGAEKCQAGSKLLYVTYEGNIYPCASVKHNPKYCMGNLKNENAAKTVLSQLSSTRDIPLCSNNGN